MFAERRSTSMTHHQQEAFLAEGHAVLLATVGRDGYPHVTPMSYWLVDGKITFSSYRKSQKSVNMLRDPRVSCLIKAGQTGDELRGLVVQGDACVIDRQDEIERLSRFRRRYEGVNPLDRLTPEQRRTSLAKRVLVVVEPRRVYSWDHRKVRHGDGYPHELGGGQ